MTGDSPRARFPRAQRITKASELDRVRKEGKRVRTGTLEVRVAASPLPSEGPTPPLVRAGIIVPRYGRSAVDRNRLKRRLRELIRTSLLPALPPMDIVVRATPGAYRADMSRLRQEIVRAVKVLRRNG